MYSREDVVKCLLKREPDPYATGGVSKFMHCIHFLLFYFSFYFTLLLQIITSFVFFYGFHSTNRSVYVYEKFNRKFIHFIVPIRKLRAHTRNRILFHGKQSKYHRQVFLFHFHSAIVTP